jgi:hypothetical protein
MTMPGNRHFYCLILPVGLDLPSLQESGSISTYESSDVRLHSRDARATHIDDEDTRIICNPTAGFRVQSKGCDTSAGQERRAENGYRSNLRGTGDRVGFGVFGCVQPAVGQIAGAKRDG